MLTGRVSGAAELRYVATLVERARVRGLKRELGEAQRAAFAPLLPAIRTETRILPSGYAPIMARAVKLSVRRRGLDTFAVVFARGRKSERDVASIDRGTLRHPRFGDRRVWYAQRVRPGFVAKPVGELGERIAAESLDALERIGRQITEG